MTRIWRYMDCERYCGSVVIRQRKDRTVLCLVVSAVVDWEVDGTDVFFFFFFFGGALEGV